MGEDKKYYIAKGIGMAILHALVTIVLPIYLIRQLVGFQVDQIGFEMTEAEFLYIQYWLLAFGFISTSMVFFATSSPPKSTRKAVFSLLMIILNSFYFFIYYVAGVSVLNLNLSTGGFIADITLDLTTMIFVFVGITALTIIVGIYDVILAIWARMEKQKEQIKPVKEFKEEKEPKQETTKESPKDTSKKKNKGGIKLKI